MQHDTTYSENAVRRILARAVELDHIRSANYSIDELRSVALEVGVSDAALQQAIAEMQPAAAAPLRAPRLRLGALVFGATAVGAVCGVIDVQTSTIMSPLVMGLFMMASGGVAVTEDYTAPGRGWRRYQLHNAVLWLGFGAAWTAAAVAGGAEFGSIESIITRNVIGFGLVVSAAFGSLVAVVHARRARAAGGGDDTPIELPLKRRVAEKLKSWIDALATRSRISAHAGAR